MTTQSFSMVLSAADMHVYTDKVLEKRHERHLMRQRGAGYVLPMDNYVGAPTDDRTERALLHLHLALHSMRRNEPFHLRPDLKHQQGLQCEDD